MPSMYAQRSVVQATQRMNEASQKLSSGTRITKAADDASGLAISERLKSQITSKGQALRNANDGLSMLQVAGGSLQEINNIIIRLREVSIQAATDTIDFSQRQILNHEYKQMLSEIDRISASSQFNGIKFLDGKSGLVEIQVDINNSSNADRIKFDRMELTADSVTIGLSGTSVLSKLDAQKNLEKMDKAIMEISGKRSKIGSIESRLEHSLNGVQISKENLSSANSRIRDTDIAEQVSEQTASKIVQQAAVGTLAQANVAPQLAMKLID